MQLGDITNCVLPTDVSPEFGPALSEMNGSAIFSENLGFNADSKAIEAEAAAVLSVNSEYLSNTTLYSGMLDDAQTDAMIAEFIEKQNANGIQDIVAEYQSQLDAWRAING